MLLRLAMAHLHNRAYAEDVVQETWLAVIQGIDGFEGRSSLNTWVASILLNKARTRAVREGRLTAFSALDDAPAVSPDRFLPPDHPEWPGHWASPPEPWEGSPEERLLAGETMAAVAAAIETLPEQQRLVITLRDVHGFGAAEVASLVGLSDGNQRVLLHRARSRVRGHLEAHFGPEGGPA